MEEILDVRELVGVSLNARTANADSLPDRQVTLGAFGLANDLGRMLWRMKYGQDVKHAGLNRSAFLLAASLRADRTLDRAKQGRGKGAHRLNRTNTGANHGDIIDRLAFHAICEWIDDRCPVCRGRGSVGGREQTSMDDVARCEACDGYGRVYNEVRISNLCHRCSEMRVSFTFPSDWTPISRACTQCVLGKITVLGKPPRLALCVACSGSGKRTVDHASRAKALGLTLEQYHRRWGRWFEFAQAELAKVDSWTMSEVISRYRHVY